jgi:hypothetical protein
LFTIYGDDVAENVTRAMGKRVSLHYEEKVGLPGSCFGETRHYVTKVTVSDEVPLAAGVIVNQAPVAPVPAPAAVSTPVPAPAPASAAN